MSKRTTSTTKRSTRWRHALALCLCLALPVAGLASDRDDHEHARRAREAGEILPLRTVLERVREDYPGEVIEVELEREHGRWEYEINLRRHGGALLKLKLDARDGTLLGIKGHDIGTMGEGGRRR